MKEWIYKGEFTFDKAVKIFGNKLPNAKEIIEIPREILKLSDDNDALGVVYDKNGNIIGPVHRSFYIDGGVNACSWQSVGFGVFIKEEEKKDIKEDFVDLLFEYFELKNTDKGKLELKEIFRKEIE